MTMTSYKKSKIARTYIKCMLCNRTLKLLSLRGHLINMHNDLSASSMRSYRDKMADKARENYIRAIRKDD